MSSSEDEAEKDVFSQRFFQLNPQEKQAILQRSESILKLSKPQNRGRAISDTNSRDLSGSDRSRPRSRTNPATSQNSSVLPEKQHSEEKVDNECQKQINESSKDAEKETKTAQEQNGCVPGAPRPNGHVREVVYTSFTDSDLSELSSQENKDVEEANSNHKCKYLACKCILLSDRLNPQEKQACIIRGLEV